MSPVHLTSNMWQLLQDECVVDQGDPTIRIDGPKQIRVHTTSEGLLIQSGQIKVSLPKGEDLETAVRACKEAK